MTCSFSPFFQTVTSTVDVRGRVSNDTWMASPADITVIFGTDSLAAHRNHSLLFLLENVFSWPGSQDHVGSSKSHIFKNSKIQMDFSAHLLSIRYFKTKASFFPLVPDFSLPA